MNSRHSIVVIGVLLYYFVSLVYLCVQESTKDSTGSRGLSWAFLRQSSGTSWATNGAVPVVSAQMATGGQHRVKAGLVLCHWLNHLKRWVRLSGVLRTPAFWKTKNSGGTIWSAPGRIPEHLKRLSGQQHSDHQVHPSQLHPHESVPAVSQVKAHI